MACKSCGGGGNSSIRVDRSAISTMPRKVTKVTTQKLGSRKLIAKTPIAMKPANSLDKHRA